MGKTARDGKRRKVNRFKKTFTPQNILKTLVKSGFILVKTEWW
jgi:hypothetical protein